MKKSLLLAMLVGGLGVHAGMFQDGDRVVFLGDSITHGGTWSYDIYDYYLTRFPQKKVVFFNAGVGGGSARGSLDWIDEDVNPKKPTHIFVMFGMNDVGRDCYTEERTAAQIKSAGERLESYDRHMRLVAEKLTADNPSARITLIAPTPFDDRTESAYPQCAKNVGCRDAIGECGKLVRAIAEECGLGLLDLYTPMVAYGRKRQKEDPMFTVVSRDRVHPREEGGIFMVWRFLLWQGADAVVSDITMDVRHMLCLKSLNAEVSDLQKDDAGAYTFRVLEKALPMPLSAEAAVFSQGFAFEDDVNQEILTVMGLEEGMWTLEIDDVAVGTWSRQDWMDGVNLAMNEKTPMAQQAKRLHEKNRERMKLEQETRDWAMGKGMIRRYVKDFNSVEELKAGWNKYLESYPNQVGWYDRVVGPYIDNFGKKPEVEAKIAAMEEELWEMRMPKAHVYRLRKAEAEKSE